MKTTEQICRNGAINRTGSQVETSPTQTAGLPISAALRGELDEAIAKNQALSWLLLDAMNGRDGGDTYGERTQFGMTHLIIQSQDRLDRAANAITGEVAA